MYQKFILAGVQVLFLVLVRSELFLADSKIVVCY